MGQTLQPNCHCSCFNKDKEDGDTGNYITYNNSVASLNHHNRPIPNMLREDRPLVNNNHNNSRDSSDNSQINHNHQKAAFNISARTDIATPVDVNNTSFTKISTKTKTFNNKTKDFYCRKDVSQPSFLQAVMRGVLARKKYNSSKQTMQMKSITTVNRLLAEFNKKDYNHTDSYIPESFAYDGYLRFKHTKDYRPFNNLGTIYKKKTMVYSDEIVKSFYCGSVNVTNQRHGKGILYTSTGEKYEGSWINNKFNGWGRKTELKSKCITEGIFTDGEINGIGRRYWSDRIYEGDFRNGKLEGMGKEESNLYCYEGQYSNDMKNGKGRMEYYDLHHVYIGEFKDNCLTGVGFYTWDNKHTYRGEFVNGNMHGKGKYEWPEGGYYEGEYLNNLKEGHGEFRWPDGKQFRGSFKNGEPDGQGKLITKNRMIDVEFINGKMILINKKK